MNQFEEHKALQESQARNQVFLEAIPDLMFINNTEGVYLDYKAEHSIISLKLTTGCVITNVV